VVLVQFQHALEQAPPLFVLPEASMRRSSVPQDYSVVVFANTDVD